MYRSNEMASTVHNIVRGCLIFTVITLGVVCRAHALDATQTVQGLYQYCKPGADSPRYGLCIGYIAGVGDAMQLLSFGVEQKPDLAQFAICDKPSYGSMVDAFVAWTEQNPAKSETNRIVGVMTALRANWPCRR
jgi:hypothetical protein